MSRRVKFIPLIVALAAAALALTMVSSGQAGKGDIYDTDHDTGSPGNPTCAQCHIPHKAQGMYLWAQVPYSEYAGESEILPLCFSCHDDAIASGGYIPAADHNHRQGVVMYQPSGGGAPYPITQHASYETSCKKCMEPDCIKCHDAHENTFEFLDPVRFPQKDMNGDKILETDTLNGSLCYSCHSGSSHGVETYVVPVPAVGAAETSSKCGNGLDDDGDGTADDGCKVMAPHTTHPEMISEPPGAANINLPVNRDWRGDTGDLNGTRLWDDSTVYLNTKGADDASQYTVASGAGDVRCMTCHVAHGAQNEELNTMAASTEVDSTAPICTNCHP